MVNKTWIVLLQSFSFYCCVRSSLCYKVLSFKRYRIIIIIIIHFGICFFLFLIGVIQFGWAGVLNTSGWLPLLTAFFPDLLIKDRTVGPSLTIDRHTFWIWFDFHDVIEAEDLKYNSLYSEFACSWLNNQHMFLSKINVPCISKFKLNTLAFLENPYIFLFVSLDTKLL